LTLGSSMDGITGSKKLGASRPVMIEVVPPICRSMERTPAFCSSAILLMLLAPRATFSSSSMPG
ncbi:MAG TPA: hypothetical protein VLM90_02945, partial [Candidatus Deferrimicrobium sp.]|nr:hypothetical protein [Candidatus Deferrimicrobium sp.]